MATKNPTTETDFTLIFVCMAYLLSSVARIYIVDRKCYRQKANHLLFISQRDADLVPQDQSSMTGFSFVWQLPVHMTLNAPNPTLLLFSTGFIVTQLPLLGKINLLLLYRI